MHFPWGHPRRPLAVILALWSPDFPRVRPFGTASAAVYLTPPKLYYIFPILSTSVHRRTRVRAGEPPVPVRVFVSLHYALIIQTKHTLTAAASRCTQFATAFANAHSDYPNQPYADRDLPFHALLASRFRKGSVKISSRFKLHIREKYHCYAK